jgi:hypothetical protein
MINHYYRVKLAVNLETCKEVAIKFLRPTAGVSKSKALESLLNEIMILS